MNWRKLLGRPEPHIHEYTWHVEPVNGFWRVFADCLCGHVSWSATVADSAELNESLRWAYLAKSLSSLGYFTAPTAVPE